MSRHILGFCFQSLSKILFIRQGLYRLLTDPVLDWTDSVFFLVIGQTFDRVWTDTGFPVH